MSAVPVIDRSTAHFRRGRRPRLARRLISGASVGAVALLALTAYACLQSGVSSAATRPTPGRTHSAAAARAVTAWTKAWQDSTGSAMKSLFTADGTYTDNAFEATWTGRDQIGHWVVLTYKAIDDPAVVHSTFFADGDHVAIVWTFTGHLRGAPKPFAVPVTTILRLCGNKIASDVDTYNLTAVFQQSGLPAGFQLSSGGPK